MGDEDKFLELHLRQSSHGAGPRQEGIGNFDGSMSHGVRSSNGQLCLARS
jgi:hypothetical protein